LVGNEGKELEAEARIEAYWRNIGERPDEIDKNKKGDHIICPLECDHCILRKLIVCNPRAR